MNDFISFDTRLPCEIHINLTDRSLREIRESLPQGVNLAEWVRQASFTKRVLTRYNPEENAFHFHICGKDFCCFRANNDPDSIVCTTVKNETYNTKNMALNSGLCFYFENGMSLSYTASGSRSGSAYARSFHYRNGSQVFVELISKSRTAINMILNAFKNVQPDCTTEEQYRPTDEFAPYLAKASQYSLAEYALEEAKAQMNEPLRYDGFEGVEYARLDNSAYRFFTDRTDDKNYPVNTRVEVSDLDGEVLRATVIDFGTDDQGRCYTDILFNTQVGVNDISTVGTVNLSFSSVNRDVQQNAITKITEGTADARYMDAVVGHGETRGFDRLDLSELAAELSSYKYPPNKSQAEAIFNGICTKDAYLVMGPPGTGKTTVILEWIKYFVKKKKMRVLVSSQNNMAVDNVLERIIEDESIDVLRIGNEGKVTEGVKPCLFELKLEKMREKIKNATNLHSESMRALAGYYSEIRQRFSIAEPLYRKKGELEKALDEACLALVSDYDAMQTRYRTYRMVEDEAEFIAQKTNKLISKEYVYRSKGAFWRILFKIGSLIRNWRIERLVKQYDDKNGYLRFSYGQYIELVEKYKENYEKTACEIYGPERELAEEILAKFGDFKVDIPPIDDRWKMFNMTECEKVDKSSYAYYDLLTSALNDGMERSSKLIAELEKWQSVSVDTSNYTLKSILLDEVDLVGATCIGINSQHRFADLKFDVTIIDEAGQIQIHNALVPMSVSNKLIMLGDHKQIPPSSDPEVVATLESNQISADLMEKSLFEDMYDRLPESSKTMLDTQFRMPAEIAEIISEWFYGGKYLSHKSKYNLESVLPVLSQKCFLVIDTSDSGNARFERNIPQGEQMLHDNPMEASVAARIVAMLVQKGYNTSKIGVIAALKAQVDLIRKEMRKCGVSSNDANEIAQTLDSYQGQERDIIIYSFGRSSAKSPDKNGVGFLTELRRLNVAMSRCKRNLVMIGDMTFLSERNSVTDGKGNPIADDEKTERNFGKFITHLLNKTDSGNGERINMATFNERMNNWKGMSN